MNVVMEWRKILGTWSLFRFMTKESIMARKTAIIVNSIKKAVIGVLMFAEIVFSEYPATLKISFNAVSLSVEVPERNILTKTRIYRRNTRTFTGIRDDIRAICAMSWSVMSMIQSDKSDR